MSGATFCRCDVPHVERVELSPLHILGPGTYWLAAKPGGVYLVGHGNHFYTEAEAQEYAFGTQTVGLTAHQEGTQ
jgi:hypothetical protein